jgi:hypothetical protein
MEFPAFNGHGKYSVRLEGEGQWLLDVVRSGFGWHTSS